MELFGSWRERELSFLEAGEREKEKVVVGLCGGCGSGGCWRESLLETRVRAPSDASQRDVHVQARAPSPTPEGLRGAVALRGDAEKGSRNSHFLFILVCVNDCGKAPVGSK